MNTCNRVFVTGMGVVTSLGLNWPDFWEALLAGRSGIRRWAPEGYGEFPVKFASPVDRQTLAAAFADEGILDEAMEHRTAFGVAAARQALRDAGLEPRTASLRTTAVVVGSGVPERDPDDMLLALGAGGRPGTTSSPTGTAGIRVSGRTTTPWPISSDARTAAAAPPSMSAPPAPAPPRPSASASA